MSFLYNALSLIRPGTGLGSRDVVHQKEENTPNEFITAVALNALPRIPPAPVMPEGGAGSSLTAAPGASKAPSYELTSEDLPEERASSSPPTPQAADSIVPHHAVSLEGRPEGGAGSSLTAAPGAPKVPPYKPIPEDLSLASVSSFYEVTRGQAYKDDFYKGMFMQPTPDMLALVDSESYLDNYNIGTRIRDERLDTIAAPTDRGLLLLASHYEHKYGIKMLIVSSQEGLAEALKGASLPPSCRSWGIIFTKGQKSELGHVTPLLCHKAEDGVIEAAVLDSIGASPSYLFTDYPDIRWSYAEKGRQSDEYSCRTDALVILKDALINLSKHPVSALEELFEMKAPSLYDRAKPFLLPSFLGRTAQISSSVKNDDAKKVVTKYGESLKEFKKRHGAKVTVEKTTTLGTYKKKDHHYYTHELPKVVIERDMNLFLNYKGKANLALTKRLVAAKNPEIFALYEAKLRAFAAECLSKDAKTPEEKARIVRGVHEMTIKEIEERMNARKHAPAFY